MMSLRDKRNLGKYSVAQEGNRTRVKIAAGLGKKMADGNSSQVTTLDGSSILHKDDKKASFRLYFPSVKKGSDKNISTY